jgi:predicted enzyme related to lactoylglutathione lyase
LSTEVKTIVGKFVWHENNSTDVEKAKSFYSSLFGWGIEVWKPGEMDYAMVQVGEQAHGGFNKAQEGAPSAWIGHVLVEDVDETVRRVEAAGGKILMGPMDIPEVGRFAVFADPQGAVLSAYSPAGDPPNPQGVFVWDELLTSDPAAAKSFYTEIFGWGTKDMDMGGMGTYTLFQRAGEVDVAGCMRLPEGLQAPPHWLVYIGTDDVDKTAAKAKDLGGTVLSEPMDIPNGIGRFAVLQDPAGAVFGIFKGNPS